MFIGSIPGITNKEIIEQMIERVPITINQAFQLVSQHMPIQDPKTGQTGYQRLVRCAPVNNCLNPSRLTAIFEGIQFFSDMQEGDVSEHKKLVRNLELMLIEARLTAVGIVKPEMKGPSGPIISP